MLVLALPSGGVPVGFALAGILRVPLDIFLVRKLGVPGYEELAMGAIASGGIRVLNSEVVHELQGNNLRPSFCTRERHGAGSLQTETQLCTDT